jgi:hypothetical protein
VTTLAIPLHANLSGGPEHVELGGETYSTVRRRMPFFVTRDQLYYWTREWQAGEREALQDLKKGDFRRFPDGTSAAEWLLTDED